MTTRMGKNALRMNLLTSSLSDEGTDMSSVGARWTLDPSIPLETRAKNPQAPAASAMASARTPATWSSVR